VKRAAYAVALTLAWIGTAEAATIKAIFAATRSR
jgi:hypothetical protein